jgi:hypothetical protein
MFSGDVKMKIGSYTAVAVDQQIGKDQIKVAIYLGVLNE